MKPKVINYLGFYGDFPIFAEGLGGVVHETQPVVRNSESQRAPDFVKVVLEPEKKFLLGWNTPFLSSLTLLLGDVVLDDFNIFVSVRPHLLMEEADGVNELVDNGSLREARNLQTKMMVRISEPGLIIKNELDLQINCPEAK